MASIYIITAVGIGVPLTVTVQTSDLRPANARIRVTEVERKTAGCHNGNIIKTRDKFPGNQLTVHHCSGSCSCDVGGQFYRVGKAYRTRNKTGK